MRKTLTPVARKLRSGLTEAEKHLWQALRVKGFEVLRFWNNDVLANLEGVFEKIEERLKTPSLTLPTRGRENKCGNML